MGAAKTFSEASRMSSWRSSRGTLILPRLRCFFIARCDYSFLLLGVAETGSLILLRRF
jgi:hypothetical protein